MIASFALFYFGGLVVAATKDQIEQEQLQNLGRGLVAIGALGLMSWMGMVASLGFSKNRQVKAIMEMLALVLEIVNTTLFSYFVFSGTFSDTTGGWKFPALAVTTLIVLAIWMYAFYDRNICLKK